MIYFKQNHDFFLLDTLMSTFKLLFNYKRKAAETSQKRRVSTEIW